MTQRVNIVNPQTGQVESIPESSLARAQETTGARRATAAEVAEAKKPTEFSPGETWLAGQYATAKGTAEAIGIPIDAAATGIASLIGKEQEEKTRKYLRDLEEKHPLISGWQRTMGNVSGALGAAELLGAPGAVSAGLPRGAAAVAGRAAYGGAENVVAATTRDINEASLGRSDANGDKLFANIPKHFAVGAGATLAFEGAGALAERGISALASKGGSALERGANRALGHEVGLSGAEAEAAGQQIRGLTGKHLGKEVPGKPSELASILETEQKSLRGEAEKTHAGQVATMEGEQAAERAALAERHAAGLEGIENTGSKMVSAAKYDAEIGALRRAEGLARQADKSAGEQFVGLRAAEEEATKGVRAAEAEGVKGLEEAHGKAFDKHLALSDAEARATGSGYREEVARAREEFDQVFAHYEGLRNQMAGERQIAIQNVAKLERAAAENTAQLNRLINDSPMTEAMLQEQVDSVMSTMGTKDPWTRWATEQQLRSHYASELAATVNGSHEMQISRARDLAQDLQKATQESVLHLKGVENAQLALENEAEKRIAAAAAKASQTVSSFQRGASREAEAAQKAVDVAMAKVRAAEADMSSLIDRARAAAADKIEKARAIGTKEAEAARKAALKESSAAERAALLRVEGAKAEAAAAKKKYEKIAGRESKALKKSHEEALSKIPEPTGKTSIDDLIAGARERMKANELRPPVSGAALVGAGLSLAHGHPGAAVTALGTSFVAGRMRAHGNYIAAEAMLNLSKRLNSIDEAVKRGAAQLVAGTGAKGAMAAERAATSEEPKAKAKPSFDEVAAQVRAAQANPQLVERSVRAALGPAADHAPDTYAATLMAAHRAQLFLQNILPPPPIDANTLTPHLQHAEVDPTTKDTFMQSYEAINDPTDLFRQAKTGEITEQKVAAAQFVVPTLMQQMRGEIGNEISKLHAPIDYEREIYIGQLLGLQTNEVLTPQFQAAQQAAFNDKSASGSPVGSKPHSGESKTTKNMQSTSEKVERGEP